MKPLQGTRLLAAAVFVAATVVLAVQLINPTPVQVSVGEGGSEVVQLSQQFRYRDVGVVAVSACLLGASGTYLVLDSLGIRAAPTTRRHVPRQHSPPRGSDGDATTNREPVADAPGSGRDAGLGRLERRIDRLGDNEEIIFAAVSEADGELRQQRLVEETDLSSATVSRTLDTLESKGLLERKRAGMGNVVVLDQRLCTERA